MIGKRLRFQVVVEFLYLVAHCPENPPLQQLLKTRLAPGTLVMSVGGVKYPALAVLTRPGVGLFGLPRLIFGLIGFNIPYSQHIIVGL